MNFNDRSYGGKIFRPQPEVLFDQDGGLLLVTTPWGPQSYAKKTNDFIRDQFFSSQADAEITTPFERLTCLTSMGNNLRLAIRLANDRVYNEHNKNEYIFGFEILALAMNHKEVCWTQVGFPNLFLNRANCALQPLSAAHELSTELGHPRDPLAPLPSHILGIDPTVDFSIRSFRPQEAESFIMISRGFIPKSFHELEYGSRGIDAIATALSEDDSDAPFWLAQVSL